MSKRKPNWADREKVVFLEEYEKRKVILKALWKVFLVDNFWGQKQGMAKNYKHSKCREFRKKRHYRNTKKKWDNIKMYYRKN